MNIPATLMPDLEGLRKAVRELQPNPHRVLFTNLKPVHDSIVELRKRNISYSAIADLLQQHGIKTSRARVAEYGRTILEGGKLRKRRKRSQSAPIANIPATPQSTPAADMDPTPIKQMPTTAPMGNVSSGAKGNSLFISRGPRIAKVEQLPPDEAEEFLASLKSKSAPEL